MSGMKETSIVIVSYHTGVILWRTIELVLSQDSLKELIIVNNGNPEDTLNRLNDLEKSDSRVKIISEYGNVGFAKGCNIGAKQAIGEYLLILNPDCLLVEKDMLVRTISEMEANPESWLASCRILLPDGSIQLCNKRNILTPGILIAQGTGLHRFNIKGLEPINIPDNPEDNISHFVPAISGAFMMFRKDKYDELGGLDERYFFHVEDLDLCLQVREKGGKILYIPSVKPVHFKSSSEVSSLFVEKHKTKGLATYFNKYKGKEYPKWWYYPLLLAIYLRHFSRIIPIAIRSSLSSRRVGPRRRKKNEVVSSVVSSPDQQKQDYGKIGPVMVTGASGQIGAFLLKKLLHNNIKTYALYHNTAIDIKDPNLTWLQGDMGSSFLNIEDVEIKTLIHTAAITMLPHNIKKLAEHGLKRLICFSSTSIEAKSKSDNDGERDMMRHFCEAEENVASECKKYGIKWTIFRPTMIYGCGLDKNIMNIHRFIEKFRFVPIVPPAKGMRQPVHAEDLANAAYNSSK